MSDVITTILSDYSLEATSRFFDLKPLKAFSYTGSSSTFNGKRFVIQRESRTEYNGDTIILVGFLADRKSKVSAWLEGFEYSVDNSTWTEIACKLPRKGAFLKRSKVQAEAGKSGEQWLKNQAWKSMESPTIADVTVAPRISEEAASRPEQ
ncbi:uncharacterized protein KY384_001404 [Bacidia gigantensis]|uniref:uncharacterized protein n=1 Tax=Bacidia gigantensis TaxID=2732470 RepID=UPI001D03F48F|nr:uncharacterized protein KY384_001404 [Bacidia gigantensis]KAG8533663.1 hypothetical protein KY384_001404 [Bacidia gigantensis]